LTAATAVDAAKMEGRRPAPAAIPDHARAVLASLHVERPDASGLSSLSETDWQRVLHLCDRSQLTLLLGESAWEVMPAWVRLRTRRNSRGNEQRFTRLKAEFAAISHALHSRGIEFVALKGFTHSPEFTPDPRLRVQGDLDLWCSEDAIAEAQETLFGLGYRPQGAAERRHLAPLFLPSKWHWAGDYFAGDAPIGVELHYKLWDKERQFDPGVSHRELWDRRHAIAVDGEPVTVLALPDRLAFAALHLMMHILRGDVRLQRAWEIARFLENHRHDERFWQSWWDMFPAPMRQLQIIAFRLATTWFGGSVPVPSSDVSPDVALWLERFAWSPVDALFHPNKDEVWLQMALATTWKRKVVILADRLFPVRGTLMVHLVRSQGDIEQIEQAKITRKFALARLKYHAVTLLPALVGCLRWWWLRQRLNRDFVMFQCASVLFTFGAFIFFLLYSLHLLDLGYREEFIGRVQSAMTAGSLLGVAPAAWISRKYGISRTLAIVVAGGVLAMLLRATASGSAALLAGAMFNGVFFSGWAVCLAPAVAELTSEKNRAVAFSLVSAVGVGTGIAAGYVGGYMPGLLSRVFAIPDGSLTRRLTLIVGALLVTTALVPILRLRFGTVVSGGKTIWPRSRFTSWYVAALALWTLATGAFNPFVNVYLTRIWHINVTSIGRISACSQAMQVAGMLAAPILLRKLGAARGIALAQIAAAGLLGLLGMASGSAVAAMLYVGYMGFQYAGEPGMFHLLMSGVDKRERNGASALHFLTVSVAGSLAALGGGAAIGRFGYSAVLGLAALLAVVAALLFGFGISDAPYAGTDVSAPAEST
jgi:Uncharacterised nucleotidyltransferase/Major Facilitator Superfamily